MTSLCLGVTGYSMVQGPRHFKRSPRSTHTKAPVMFDYLVTAASAAAAYPNPPSNARCAASNCTELPGRMADFERKSAIRVHVTGVMRTKSSINNMRPGC